VRAVIPLVFVSILATKTWGFRLKLLSLIGMWIPVALFLPVVLVTALGLGLAYGLFDIWTYTFVCRSCVGAPLMCAVMCPDDLTVCRLCVVLVVVRTMSTSCSAVGER
jgi:hypothetical protein